MKSSVYLILLVAIISGCGVGNKKTGVEVDSDRNKLANICDSVVEMIAKERDSSAMELLKSSTVISPITIDTLRATFVSQKGGEMAGYGRLVGSEFVTERCVNDFLCKRFYLLRFEQYYLKVDFTIYKTSSGWKITNFNYNEDLTEVLY
jgi:hypothetical protein